jgi:hypothetical protein
MLPQSPLHSSDQYTDAESGQVMNFVPQDVPLAGVKAGSGRAIQGEQCRAR